MSAERCPACGEPKADHLGPPSPPLTRGHLGATEDRPGSCLTKRGEVEHRRAQRPMFPETSAGFDLAMSAERPCDASGKEGARDTFGQLARQRSRVADERIYGYARCDSEFCFLPLNHEGECPVDQSDKPIKARTPGEREAYIAGYAQALVDCQDHGLEFARRMLIAVTERLDVPGAA